MFSFRWARVRFPHNTNICFMSLFVLYCVFLCYTKRNHLKPISTGFLVSIVQALLSLELDGALLSKVIPGGIIYYLLI